MHSQEFQSHNGRFVLLTQWLIVITIFTLPLSTTLCDICFIAALISCLLQEHLREKINILLHHPIPLLLLAFFFLNLIGTTYSIAPMRNMLGELSKSATLLIGAILMTGFVQTRFRQYAINAFLLAMILTLVISFIKHFHPFEFMHRYEPSNVFKDHIIQNFLMAVAIFIFLYRSIHARKWRWVYGLLTIGAIYNVLFISTGRSGYFIFSVIAIFMFANYFRWKGLIYGLLCIILFSVGAWLISDSFRERIISGIQDIEQYQQGNVNTSLGIRFQSFRNAVILLKKHPFLGSGTGSFSTAYARLPAEEKANTDLISVSYNNYLNIGVELGLLGVIFIIFMFYTQWRNSFLLEGEIKFVTQIIILSMVFGCLVNPWLNDTTELHFYALFLAVGFSALNERFMTKASEKLPVIKNTSLKQTSVKFL